MLGAGVETTGSSEGSLISLKNKKTKQNIVALPSSPEQGSRERSFSPKNKREMFSKEGRALETPGQVLSVVPPASCTRFFYSIFLAVLASLFAEGWERPSVSGTCPSVTVVQVCLVSCVWPHPDHHHQHLHVAHGMPHLPHRCPPGLLAVGSPSWQPGLPGSETARPGQVGAV